MSKLTLGLDIGIASVGWGIIDDETGNIVDAGVRLFEEATRNGNEDRRSYRGTRRLIRRRQHRLARTRELLDKAGFPCEEIGKVDPYQARYDAIYGQVTAERLAAALFHLVKRRGTTLDVPEDDAKEATSELSTKKQIKENEKRLADRYICELQLERIAKQEVVRNHENRFRTESYLKEAEAILEAQEKHFPMITEAFKEDYLALIETRRMYYEGPGSEKSPTPYGQYSYGKNGEIEYVTMINKMRGRCTYYPDQFRIAKMAYTAELFGLLNDLNNMSFPDPETGEKVGFTEEQKREIVEKYVHDPKGSKNITMKILMKVTGVTEEIAFQGQRVNLKSGKPIFTEFKGLKAIQKLLKDVELPDDFYRNADLLDEIADILSSEKSYQRRENQLATLFQQYDNEDMTEVIERLKEDTTFKEYHSLSKKAILEILPELWETNDNQMQLFIKHGMDKSRLEMLERGSKIRFDDEAILSSVAKRAHRETIKIVNAVREKYGELDYVVVEMAREKNSDEAKKNYQNMQKAQGKFENEMCKLLGVKNLAELHLNGKQHLALKLWKQQDGKCIYSGKRIDLNQIIQNMGMLEIDHIIPISISYDDSQKNKVLCLKDENQKKGQRSPYQYMMSGKASRGFEEFKQDVIHLPLGKQKRNYLLEMEDIANNPELRKRFINRNLVDTRYAMRSFANTLRTFYLVNEIPTKVMSINGQMTSALRRKAKLNKDRDAGHSHHALDALIVAGISRLGLLRQLKDFKIDEAGELAADAENNELSVKEAFDEKSILFFKNLKNYESKIKYSHKVDRKPNRSLSNQTLYSTREKDGDKYVVGKVKNIYELDKKGYEAFKKRVDKNPDNFLMAQHDPKTWALILKVMEEHKHADNPFQDYKKEHGYILKDGKVPVKALKYLDKKLGVHISLKNKFKVSKNDVVLLSRNSIRVDIYMNKEGVYKYLGVPYVWFEQQGSKYELNQEFYVDGMKAAFKKIDKSYDFQFSLYKNDLITYYKEEVDRDTKNRKSIRYEKLFRGDNNPRQNKMEVEDVDKKNSERQLPAINPLKSITKYNVDILGNKYPIKKEEFVTTYTLQKD
ncbi:type II CRISPR RNA-guided endonuclease Cas9 [Listeria costaricensis]|uniref:type II CRISPR RNA-guided endonuclease Cas9 n=1 Tax=Listeria costaricensis TaxID=2026604 RepID=UPI0013C4CF30|nr:type II CRISPR RNA-guided endonuclease Cas9 [Listeria costaricensis]